MEILDQLANKVQKAVDKIKELKAQVKKLEETNRQKDQKIYAYEQKMNELIQTLESVEISEQPQ